MRQINVNITNPGNYGSEETQGLYPCWPSTHIKWDNTKEHDCRIWVDYWEGVESSTAKLKVAVLVEPKSLCPHNYSKVNSMLDAFDLVFSTYPEDVLIHPKYRYYRGGARSFIRPEEREVYEKNKNICAIVSRKNFLPGHNVRHHIKSMIQMGRPDLVDFINPPMASKVSGLKDYRFELVVENEDSNFFSEKPIDSMLCGCIPIYWTQRTPSYLNCFDMNGIVLFQTPEELYQKLCDGVFNEEFYQDRLQAVKYNFEKAKDYVSFGDVLWNAGLDNFLKNNKI